MGTEITLGIKKFEIDWGKNNFFRNHSKLYRRNDFDKIIKYYYSDNVIENKTGASNKLVNVKKRLDLLGYSVSECEKMYNETAREYEYLSEEEVNLSFDEYRELLYYLNIEKLNTFRLLYYYESSCVDYDFGEFFGEIIIDDIKKCNKRKSLINNLEKIKSYECEFFENLDPYITLRLLAENEKNDNYDVDWRYYDDVESGWIEEDKLFTGLDESDKITIITEGKTDSMIIDKTIRELYPEISDFFSFIDMEENYPFGGATNLNKFCIGLNKLKILNNIIVIFDNDIAGLEQYNDSIKKCNLDNMLILHLPDLPEFERLKCKSEDVCTTENINGKGVAIECFLDFKSLEEEPIIIKRDNNWSFCNGIKKNLQKTFEKSNLTDNSYNSAKLKYLIDYILKEYIANKSRN